MQMIEKAIVKASQLPCFKNPKDIQPLSGGITNVNLCISDGGQRFVVRMGTDIPEHGIMRWNELELSKAAEAADISPKVHYHEEGVLVLQYIQAKTYDEKAVRKPENLERIIKLIKKTHEYTANFLETPILTFWPFQINRTYIKRLQKNNSIHCSKLPQMQQNLEKLETAIGPVQLVVGHNDLLAANILDDGNRLWLIDWEYGGYNSPLFDLAGLASNNSMSKDQELHMLEQYYNHNPEKFWQPYQTMKCVSLMRETLWSMTAEIFSEIDFDYSSYTSKNLKRFENAFDQI